MYICFDLGFSLLSGLCVCVCVCVFYFELILWVLVLILVKVGFGFCEMEWVVVWGFICCFKKILFFFCYEFLNGL